MTNEKVKIDDVMNVCRLCLGSDDLISLFDDIMNIPDNMLDIIQVTTGVAITPSDNVSKKLCDKCFHITIKMFKFRSSSVVNNKLLKEKAGTKLKPYIHKSIEMLLSKYPTIVLPSSISRTDMNPVVMINVNEVINHKTKTHGTKKLKRRDIIQLESKLTSQKTELIDVENVIMPVLIPNKEFLLRSNTPEQPENVSPTLSPDKPELTSEVTEPQNLTVNLVPTCNDGKETMECLLDGKNEQNKTKRRLSDEQNSTNSKKLKTEADSVNKNYSVESLVTLKYVTKTLMICDICNGILYTAKDLKKHKMNHMKCNICKKTFRSLDETKKHKDSECTIKKIMNNLPTIILERCDKSKELRKQYPLIFDALNKKRENVNVSSLPVEPDDIKDIPEKARADVRKEYPLIFDGVNKKTENVNFSSLPVGPQTDYIKEPAQGIPKKVTVNVRRQYPLTFVGMNEKRENVNISSLPVEPQTDDIKGPTQDIPEKAKGNARKQFPLIFDALNKKMTNVNVSSLPVEPQTGYIKEPAKDIPVKARTNADVESKCIAEISLISDDESEDQSSNDMDFKHIPITHKPSNFKNNKVNSSEKKTNTAKLLTNISMRPDINIVGENIFDVNLDDDEPNILKHILRRAKKDTKDTCAQTDIPCNADIQPSLNKNSLFCLKNLKNFLACNKIPVNLSFSPQHSIKFSSDPSPLLKKGGHWSKHVTDVTMSSKALPMNIPPQNTVSNTTTYQLVNSNSTQVLSTTSSFGNQIVPNNFVLNDSTVQQSSAGNKQQESNSGVTFLVPSIVPTTINYPQMNNPFSIVTHPMLGTLTVSNSNSNSVPNVHQSYLNNISEHNYVLRDYSLLSQALTNPKPPENSGVQNNIRSRNISSRNVAQSKKSIFNKQINASSNCSSLLKSNNNITNEINDSSSNKTVCTRPKTLVIISPTTKSTVTQTKIDYPLSAVPTSCVSSANVLPSIRVKNLSELQ